MQLYNKDFNKNILVIKLQKLNKLIKSKLEIQFNRYFSKSLDKKKQLNFFFVNNLILLI